MSEFVPLKRNQRVELADGRSVVVTGRLGEGGQGIVYRVRFDDGEERALKWFFVGSLKDPRKFERDSPLYNFKKFWRCGVYE